MNIEGKLMPSNDVRELIKQGDGSQHSQSLGDEAIPHMIAQRYSVLGTAKGQADARPLPTTPRPTGNK